MRVAGVIGAALLLIGVTLIALQLLLRAFESPTSDERDLPAEPPANEETAPPDEDGEPEPLAIVEASDFDPEGDGVEHPDDVSAAYDGDVATTWETQTYFSPLEDQKPGVGIYLDLGEVVDIRQVNLNLFGSDSQVELRVAPSDAGAVPSDIESWEQVTDLEVAGDNVEHELAEPASSRYLLVWFTRLPPIGDGDYRGGIAEVEVLG
jgi:putative peptidoglycan lipid II flippase